MSVDYALWDTLKEIVVTYPRLDNQPVSGLSNRYLVLTIVREEKPEIPEGWSIRETRQVNLETLIWNHGWELIEPPPPPAPQPNYFAFYQELLSSATYQKVMTMPATTDLVRSLVVFVSNIQDALSGRVNETYMQNAIWLLLGQAMLTGEEIAEISGLMDTHNLSLVYSLEPS